MPLKKRAVPRNHMRSSMKRTGRPRVSPGAQEEASVQSEWMAVSGYWIPTADFAATERGLLCEALDAQVPVVGVAGWANV